MLERFCDARISASLTCAPGGDRRMLGPDGVVRAFLRTTRLQLGAQDVHRAGSA